MGKIKTTTSFYCIKEKSQEFNNCFYVLSSQHLYTTLGYLWSQLQACVKKMCILNKILKRKVKHIELDEQSFTTHLLVFVHFALFTRVRFPYISRVLATVDITRESILAHHNRSKSDNGGSHCLLPFYCAYVLSVTNHLVRHRGKYGIHSKYNSFKKLAWI